MKWKGKKINFNEKLMKARSTYTSSNDERQNQEEEKEKKNDENDAVEIANM